MKRLFKVFFIFFSLVSTGIYLSRVVVEASQCPDAPSDALISICGVVKSAMPVEETSVSGKTSIRSQKGVEGVSVAIYECDNSSPSCKQDGKLVYPFASTLTNENGGFVIYARKIDGDDKLNDNPDKRNESKRRYLVFKCNGAFAGFEVLPSYQEWNEIIKEVNCPDLLTDEPLDAPIEIPIDLSPAQSLQFVSQLKVSNQMGSKEDREMEESGIEPKPGDPDYVNSLTKQVVYDIAPAKTELNFDLQLIGADPRFTQKEDGGFLSTDFLGFAETLLRHTPNPKKGAFWSLDCHHKYDGTHFEKFCVGKSGEKATEEQIAEAEKSLYNNDEWLIQNKLPNIPYRSSLLYYKELASRQDVTEVIQDPTDVVRYNQLHYSNCAGTVFLRYEGADKEDKYPNCEIFKECNKTISDNGVFRNSYTTGGPAKQLSAPSDTEPLYYYLADLNTPICKINPENEDEDPIKLSEIQPPWVPGNTDTQGNKYKLDKSYWNAEFVMYFGNNNLTSKVGFRYFTESDSYDAPKDVINTKPFEALAEAGGVPQQGGFWETLTGGGYNSNSSLTAVHAYTGGTASLTDYFSTPAEDEKDDREIVSQTSIYTLAGIPRVMGSYSNVNTASEGVIINPDDDKKAINNNMFEGNEDHYPSKKWFSGGGENDGTRTPTSGLYITSAAYNRHVALKDALPGNDFYDSLLTIMSGDGDITDYSINALEFIKTLFFSFGTNRKDLNKSFLDRANTANLGTPGFIDDLRANFPLSEENFTEIFWLPHPGDVLGKESWGEHSCYPWTVVKIGNACDTAVEDYGISRTCRVDHCKTSYIETEWECTLKGGRPVKSNIKVGNLIIENGVCDGDSRLACARKQTSCLDKNGEVVDGVGEVINGVSGTDACVRKTYEDIIDDASTDNHISCPDDLKLYEQAPDGVIKMTERVETPACTMSVAGPYACFGDLNKESAFILEQQPIRDDDTIDLSNAYVADQKIRMNIQSPADNQFTNSSYMAYSANASVRSPDSDVNDIAKGVDNIGPGTGGGGLNSAWLRSAFGPPSDRNSSASYNPVDFHCNNDELESSGSWDCTLYSEPYPVIIDVDNLENTFGINQTCALNPSRTCRALISGLFNPVTKDEIYTGAEPPELSDTFIKVLGTASTHYDIPASLLIVYMEGVGQLRGKHATYWDKENEEALINVTAPWYGTFGNCDDVSPSAQGPLDWRLSWFNKALDAYGGRDFLNSIATGRGRTASRCNFLDAVVGASANLSSGGGGTCSDWHWEDDRTKNALTTMTFGSDPKGAYATDGRYNSIRLERFFEECRY